MRILTTRNFCAAYAGIPAAETDGGRHQNFSMNDFTDEEPLNSATVSKNILSMSGGVLASRMVAFSATIYLARVLGVDGFGIIGFATALFGFGELVVTAGFNTIGARAVARRRQDAAAIAWSVILVRLILALIAMGFLGVMALMLDKPPVVKLVIALTALSLFPLALDTSWVYEGLERCGRSSLALIASQILYVVVVFMIVRGPGQVYVVPLATFLGGTGAALMLGVPLFRSFRFNFDLSEGWAIFKNSGFLTVSRMMRSLIFSFDVILIGLMLGERETGLYTAPYRICYLLLAFGGAIQVSYLPAMTRAWSLGLSHVTDVARRSIEFSAAVAAPLVVGGMIIAVPLLNGIFGPGYEEGATAFKLLLLSIGLVMIHSALRNVLIVGEHAKTDMWIVGIATVFNVVLNFLVIPQYRLPGAAAVTVLSETIVLLLGFAATRRLGVRANLWPLVRPLLAAGVMGVVLLKLGDRPLPLLLGAGAVVYAGVLLTVRGIPQDAQPQLQAIASFFRGLAGKKNG